MTERCEHVCSLSMCTKYQIRTVRCVNCLRYELHEREKQMHTIQRVCMLLDIEREQRTTLVYLSL